MADDKCSSESLSDGEERYGELFELKKPLSLEDYTRLCFGVVQNPIAQKTKIEKYTVTRTSDNAHTIFGVKKGRKEYFAKYCLKAQYEAEKRCHEILDPLNCPSIIKMVDAIALGEGGIIITPIYERYHKKVFYGQTKSVVRQVFEAIKVCHEHCIAHRDIKPSNLVWDYADEEENSVRVLLTDFGLACCDFTEYQNKTITFVPGTLLYSSPERLLNIIPSDPRVSDVFSAGVYFLEMVATDKRHIFEQGTWQEILATLTRLDELCRMLIPSAIDVLKKMLEFDFNKRITIQEVLAHDFFADTANGEDYLA